MKLIAGGKHFYIGISVWILMSCGIPEGHKLPINSTSKNPVGTSDKEGFHTNNVIGSPDYTPQFQLTDFYPKDLKSVVSETQPITLIFDQDTWTPEAVSYLIKGYAGSDDISFQVSRDDSDPKKAILTGDWISLSGAELTLKVSSQLISKMTESLRFITGLKTTPRRLSSFNNHICEINSQNDIHCLSSHLFHGDFSSDTQKEKLFSSFADPIAITAGSLSICAINQAGKAACFDYLNGKKTNPEDLDSHMFSKISASRSGFCGLTLERSVICWEEGKSELIIPEDLGEDVLQLNASQFHQCAKKVFENELYCWGNNSKQQISDLKIAESATPLKTAFSFNAKEDGSDASVVSFSLGLNFSCALSDHGQVACVGTYPGTKSLEEIISPDETYTKIWSGHETLCGQTSTDKILCVGNNSFHQLGKINDTGKFTPETPGNLKISKVIAGQSFILFETESSTDLFATGIVPDIDQGALKVLDNLSPFKLNKSNP